MCVLKKQNKTICVIVTLQTQEPDQVALPKRRQFEFTTLNHFSTTAQTDRETI